MSVWSFVLYVLLPIGVVLLGVLTIPLPSVLSTNSQCRALRGLTLKLLHRLLFTNLNGTLPLSFIHLLLLILLCITVFMGNEVMSEYRHHLHSEGHQHAHADVLMMQQGKLWRNQRNCYLALSSLITYWALYCVLLYQERIHRLEEILHNAPTHSTHVQSQATSSKGSAAGTRESAVRVTQSQESSDSIHGKDSGQEGIPRQGKSEQRNLSAAENESETAGEDDDFTTNPLLRQRGTATGTGNVISTSTGVSAPSAPPASLIDSNFPSKKDK